MENRVSRFGGLPATPLAWSGVAVAVVYTLVLVVLSQGWVGGELPAWLAWTFGIGIGAVALGLCIAAYARKERSWLLLVAVVVSAFWWLQWAILGVYGLTQL